MAISADNLSLAEDELLRRQIFQAQKKLGGLEKDLGRIEAELDGLGEQRETYDLLEAACGALEKLDALGAGTLFWGEGATSRTDEHVRQVRQRSEAYLSHIGEIERHRDSVVLKMREGQDVLDILEADLYELELAEEERKQEWVVEREIDEPDRVAVMPWSRTEDDRRLRKSMLANVLAALMLGAIIPLIDLPIPELDLIPELPERFANLIERELPTPPPAPVVEQAPPPEEVEPEPTVAETEPEIVPEAPEEPAPAAATEEAAPEREVRSAGILAFSESFASLSANRTGAELGAQARINDAGEAAVGRTERAMVASQAPGSSGGINLANLSRDVGGSGGAGDRLDGVEITSVASSIGVSGTGDRPLAAGAAAGRTDEEIQIVFDRYKSALYRLYNRELRNDPTLRGQVVLHLTIEPDGSVSFLEIRSSDLGSPVLEQQIAERVRSFDFGAKEGITAVTILYPIDFLPAG
jgi:outer membrane biosynthesis protein TonB